MDLSRVKHIKRSAECQPYTHGDTTPGVNDSPIDLGERLGLDSGFRNGHGRVIFIRVGKNEVGILVDRVSQILGDREHRYLPYEPSPSDVDLKFIRSVVVLSDRRILLLDIELLLNDRL